MFVISGASAIVIVIVYQVTKDFIENWYSTGKSNSLEQTEMPLQGSDYA